MLINPKPQALSPVARAALQKSQQTRGEQGVETIEAAVLKMARIVAHFTTEGGQGAQLAMTMAEASTA
jgi:hypothetical protein